MRRSRFIVFLFVLMSIGCVDKEVRLDPEEMGLIDSLYLDERGVMVKQFEDTCALYHDMYFDQWVDSLMTVRLEKIEKMMKR